MKYFVLATIAIVIAHAAVVKRQAELEEGEIAPPFTCFDGKDENITSVVCNQYEPVCNTVHHINAFGEVILTIRRCKAAEACRNNEQINQLNCKIGNAGVCHSCCDTSDCNFDVEPQIFS